MASTGVSLAMARKGQRLSLAAALDVMSVSVHYHPKCLEAYDVYNFLRSSLCGGTSGLRELRIHLTVVIGMTKATISFKGQVAIRKSVAWLRGALD